MLYSNACQIYLFCFEIYLLCSHYVQRYTRIKSLFRVIMIVKLDVQRKCTMRGEKKKGFIAWQTLSTIVSKCTMCFQHESSASSLIQRCKLRQIATSAAKAINTTIRAFLALKKQQKQTNKAYI